MDAKASATPLVGRERELEQLETALDALGDGVAGCLTVEGEPGIGKTRLLRELADRAEDRGHLVLGGTAAEFEHDMPFGVWIDALDAYVASQDLQRRPAWDAALADELGRVLPSQRRASPGPDDALVDERFRVHRAVRSLLTMLADDQALVLVLDDLHWSDGASLELLASLVRRGIGGAVLLVLAFRPAQAPERLAAALTAPALTRLCLEPLDESEAALLLGPMDAGAAALIHRHGGGNPFYLEQLARASGSGTLSLVTDAVNGAVVGVPAAVAAALAEELASVPSSSRALLDAAAVAGEPFEPDLAAAIAGLERDAALAALDDLLAIDLVRPTQVPRRFTFRHPLVRRAVYESTGGGWRLAAHAAAADVLAARGAGAGEIAYHVEQSAAPGDEAAIALLREAGTAAATRAPATAVRWFEAALRLLPSGDEERQVDVRVALASAQRSAGELERCRTTLLDATELLSPDAVARRIELTALCAAVEHWLGRHDDAHRRLTRAWEDLPDRGTAEGATLQIELAIDSLYRMEFARAQEMARGAVDTVRGQGDRALHASAASALALSEAVAGHSASARAHRDEAVELLDSLSDAELAPRLEALYYLAWAENYLERYDDSLAHVDRGIAIARATGEGRLLVPLMLTKGYPFEMQGRLAEAIDTCATAIEIARMAANPHYLFWAQFEMAWARFFAGQVDEAIAAGEESRRVGGRMIGATMPSAGGGPGWVLASCRLSLGEPAALLEMVTTFGDEQLPWAIPVEKSFNWEVLALAELALGRPDRAELHIRRAEENSAALGLLLPAAVAARGRAAVLLGGGDAAGAVQAATASVSGLVGAGAWLQVAFSRHVLGRALAELGDRPGAIAALREAENDLDRFGCTRVRDEVRRDLRKLGARAEPRGPATAEDAGLGALTRREGEIAGLITDRLTNREIASRLFLSEKTIESHVRNIFIKLGVSSRVGVARAVERERAQA